MAVITKRPNGKFQAVVRKKGHPTKCKTFSKKSLASQWAKELELSFEINQLQNKPVTRDWILSDAIESWVTKCISIRAESSEPRDRSRANKLIEYFGGYHPDNLLPKQILDWAKDQAEEGYKSSTIKRTLTSWGSIISDINLILEMPCRNPIPEAKQLISKTRALEAEEGRDRRPSPDELFSLACVKHSNETVIDYIILFAIETGLRRGELARAAKEYIDFNARTMRVPKSKTDWKTGKKGRTIPLSDLAMQIVSLMPDNETLFSMAPDSISQAFGRVRDVCNIKDLTLHDLRHEAISRWFEMGLEIQEVAAISGHSNWQSLKKYTQLSSEHLHKKLGSS